MAMPPYQRPRKRATRRQKIIIAVLFGVAAMLLLCGVVSSALGGTTSTAHVTISPAGSLSSSPRAKTPAIKPEQIVKTTKPKPVVYASLTSRQWLKLAKDPDGYTGESYVVYGVVTQFDSATGTDSFRADVDGVKHSERYDYDTNTVLANVSADLSDIVEGDQFTAKVIVVGGYSYETTIGGDMTVPQLAIASITRR